ncbi:solute carrier family 35 member E1-like isoform X2 [Watersipora subatra]
MPMFTIILSRIFMNETQTFPVYLSILPIIAGVCVATATELSFDLAGLVSALIATLGFSCLNIFTKKALRDTGIHHLRMLLIISKITFIMFIPVWLFIDLRNILSDDNVMKGDKVIRCIVLLIADAFANFTINVVAFTLLSLVTPLSYAVANATKRIVIISSSLILLRNPVTTANVGGMLLAVLGVLMYNKAKYDQAKLKRQQLLPLVRSEPNIFHRNLHLSPLHRTNTEFDLQNHVSLLPTSDAYLNGIAPVDGYR